MLSQDLLFQFFYHLFIMLPFLQSSFGKHSCIPSACGHIGNIRHPFRLRDDPQHCGDSSYQLSCENNTTLIYFGPQKYLVQAINYHNYTIRLTDPTVKNSTCSFPEHCLSGYNFTGYPYSIRSPFVERPHFITRPITFMSCPYPGSNSVFLEITHCFDRNYGFDIKRNNRSHTYIKFGHLDGSNIMDMCEIYLTVMSSLPVKDENNVSLSEIHSSLLYGFELSWFAAVCVHKCNCWSRMLEPCKYESWCHHQPICSIHQLAAVPTKIVGKLLDLAEDGLKLHLALRILIGIACMLWLLIYNLRRRHLSVFDVIEGFLQSNNNLIPIRYSYSDIKKMTRGFREKLGEGGYGSVYKGKLRSGHEVAVKVLGKSRANGQDFINEVATIGRIHHVNVVKLVGYCAERSKRALVYDFMPNGSLDKYIFNREAIHSLSWETKLEIAIGVACGIEYLHQGCNIHILHFDIKPHNILLDNNFTPKVSDFGLAKFYSVENTTVTLTAARGTIGYVAPELINRSIGPVSYKADVYSFGMLLMEMLGLNKDMIDDESSKYFPYWIYDHFTRGKDIEIGNINEDNDEFSRKITKKMAIIGLWCIRMSPSDRPSMTEVLKMLGSDSENLQVPPLQPFQSPQVTQGISETWGIESTDSVALLGDDVSDDE